MTYVAYTYTEPSITKIKNSLQLNSIFKDEIPVKLLSEFYHDQQIEINSLRKEETNLLDKAAMIRRQMNQFETLPEKCEEWHQLQSVLHQVETKLVRINESIDTYGKI